MKMKLKIWMLAWVSLALSPFVFAASDDTLVAFSTRGPDRYADGAPVQVGEMYALVWSRAGCAFAGFDLNGNVVDPANNALVAALPLAKYSSRLGGAHCPVTLFQIDAARARRLAGGTYALVLLDTRISDGRGGLKPSGRLGEVKGWGQVEASRLSPSGIGLARALDAGGTKGAVTTATSVVPIGEMLPTPRITAIQVENDQVRLKVKGTSPRLLYNVVAGDRPEMLSARRVARTPQQGLVQADGEIELVVPVREDRRFFTVTPN